MRSCETCRHTLGEEYCNGCTHSTFLHKWEPRRVTNADRIRSMTDEELAGVLLTHKCKGCDWDGGYCGGKAEIACRKEILLWLKEEVQI